MYSCTNIRHPYFYGVLCTFHLLPCTTTPQQMKISEYGLYHTHSSTKNYRTQQYALSTRGHSYYQMTIKKQTYLYCDSFTTDILLTMDSCNQKSSSLWSSIGILSPFIDRIETATQLAMQWFSIITWQMNTRHITKTWYSDRYISSNSINSQFNAQPIM